MKNKKFLPVLLLIATVFGLFLLAQRRETPKTVASVSHAFDRIPVAVAVVSQASLRDSVALVGTIEAFREADIFSESEGIVRRVSAEPGDQKKAGELLLLLDNEVAAIRHTKADVFYRQKKRDVERYNNLYHEGAVTLSLYETAQLQYEEAKAELVAASRKMSDAAIKAPFAGEITDRFVEQGELVRVGTKVAHLVDLSRAKVVIFVPEQVVTKFDEGQQLTVVSVLFPGEKFNGTVGAVSSKSGLDHTYRVEVVLPNRGASRFRSGMFATVISSGAEASDVLMVPRIALVSGIRKPEVFVVRNGKARLKPFVAGRELQNNLEVLSALAVGDSVVISGQSELHDGADIRVIGQPKGAVKP